MNLFPYKAGSQRVGSNVPGVNFERGFIASFKVLAANAVAQDLVSVLAATALTAATQEITVGITNPLAPRNFRVKGNAVGVAGNVVITGTNYLGQEITETFALSGADTIEGSKAFKTVTKIDLPVEANVGTDTVSAGVGNKLGLPYRLSLNTVLAAYRAGAKEGTAPTVAINNADIESNTVLLNSALNGTEINVLLVV